jgi:hypothetical protein
MAIKVTVEILWKTQYLLGLQMFLMKSYSKSSRKG